MRRFTVAAEKVFAALDRKLTAEEATEHLLNEPCDLQKEMLRYEGALIKQALAKTNGRLTKAASQLTLSYQALAYIINVRHKDLLKDRSSIRRRSRKALDVRVEPHPHTANARVLALSFLRKLVTRRGLNFSIRIKC